MSLQRAVFVVVAALAASALAQYPPDTHVPYQPYGTDTGYGTAYHEKPDSYGVPDPHTYGVPDPTSYVAETDQYAAGETKPYDTYNTVDDYGSVLPPSSDYSYGYGYGYGQYGHDAFGILWKQVVTKIASFSQQVHSVIEFRDQTLASIDKISSLTMAWCRSE